MNRYYLTPPLVLKVIVSHLYDLLGHLLFLLKDFILKILHCLIKQVFLVDVEISADCDCTLSQTLCIYIDKVTIIYRLLYYQQRFV